MKLKRFSDTMKPSTAVVRRLLEDYEGSGRTIFGDSWFTNMNTIEMVRSIGNFYVGMVKIGHAGIPKKYMNTVAFNGPDAKRGDHMTLHLGNDSQRIICVGWNEPGKKTGKKSTASKVLIGTTCSGSAVTPWNKTRHVKLGDGNIARRTLEIPQPSIVQRYYRAANKIDIANQYRQGVLGIERIWNTKQWKCRLFQTFLGICFCNAYSAYRHFEKEDMSMEFFTVQVVEGLVERAGGAPQAQVDIMHDVPTPLATRAKNKRRVEAAMDEPDHALISNATFSLGTSCNNAGRCRICDGNRAHHFCRTCTKDMSERGDIFLVCSPGKHGRHCYVCHLHNVLGGSASSEQ